MIKYDYCLKRQVGTEKVQEFTPQKIFRTLPNIVCIEGPNSLGKSTLLNIIALSFYGTSNPRIHPALTAKMNSLMDKNYQKLVFQVEINTEKAKISLRSAKSSYEKDEIIVEESIDGKPFKPLSRDTFQTKYNLIYDIPSNPTERMQDLLKELQDEQLRYGNRLRELNWFIRDAIKEIETYRNPKRLQEITNGLEKNSQELKEIAESLPKIEVFLDALEKNAYAHWFYWYLNEFQRLESDRLLKATQMESLDKSARETSKKLVKMKKELPMMQGALFETYNDVTKLMASCMLEKEKPRFKSWRKLNPYSTEDVELNSLKNESTHFIRIFTDEIEKTEKNNSFNQAQMIGRLIDTLKEFEDSPILIPKLKVTIGQIIDMMKEENSKNYVMLSRYTTLKDIKQHLSELRDQVDTLLTQLKAVNESLIEDAEFSEKLTDSYYIEKEQLDALEQAAKNAGTKCHAYLSKCLSKGLQKAQLESLNYAELSALLPQSAELKQLLSLTENQINDKISNIEKEIETKKERIKTLRVIIDQYQKEKDQLEKQKPHKYENCQAMLDALYQRTQGISSKLLSEYEANLKIVKNKRVTKDDLVNDKKTKYFEEVSKYLAYRIGVFRHIGTFYRASRVDLLSEEIITDDGLTIHFVDMGTGESQSAYILGLLSSVKNDNRRIIALFDEIAMMDNTSLKPILMKMQELYKEEKLLIGIMAQKSEEIATRAPECDSNGPQ